MYLTQKEKINLRVDKSRNGMGIFSKRIFIPYEKIFEVKGKFLTCNEEDEVDQKTRANTYRYDEDLYISPKGRIGDYLNHSCNPNTKIVKQRNKLFVQAIRLIPSQKEILIDYSTIIASDDSWVMKCNCGSRNCRKKIGKFKSLPPQLKNKYISLGIVPRYILEL